jgi:uncharacterized repeat protein (TIGR01451 family)
LVFVGSTPTPDSTNGNVLSFNLPPIPSGGSLQVGIAVTPTNAGNFTSTTTVNANEPDPDPANNTFAQTTQVYVQTPQYSDLAITHTIAPNPVTISNQVTLTLTATNQGPSDSASATIVDALPAGLRFVSAVPAPNAVSGQLVSFGTGLIASGGSVTVVIQALPVAVGTLANIASVTGANIDNNAWNNQSRVELAVNAAPVLQSDLSVTLDSSTNEAYLGSNFTVSETVTNLGPDPAANTVLTTAIPTGLSVLTASSSSGTITTNGGTLQASLGTLASGAGATVTFTGTPTSSRLLVIVATAASASNDPVPTNNHLTVWIGVPSSVHAQNLIVNGSFENIDGTFSPNASGFMDLLPGATDIPGWTVTNGQLTWLSNTNAANLRTPFGSFFLDLTGEDDTAPYGGVTQTIATTPSQTYTLTLSLGANLDNSDFAGEKTVLVTTGSSSNLFTFTPTGRGNQWGTFGFDFVATNASTAITITGSSPGSGDKYLGLDNVSVVPKNLIFNGSFENIDGTYSQTVDGYMELYPGDTTIPGWTVTNDQLAWGSNTNVSNVMTPSGSFYLDLTGDNDNGSFGGVTQTIATSPSQTYTLTLSLGANLDPVCICDGTKTVSVTAGGSSTLFTFTPTGTNNQWGTFSFDFVATNASTAITITGVSAGSGYAYLGLDNVSVVLKTASSLPAADLSVTQTNTPASVSVADDVVYTISVVNSGPDAGSGVMLTDDLPTNTTFVTAHLSQGAWSISNNVLTADLGSIVSNGTVTLSLHLTAVPQGVLTNFVSVLGTEQDPNPNNNAAVSLLTVQPIGSPGSIAKADLSVSQTAPASIGLGQLLTYSLTVTNAGPYSATNVTLNDALPAGASFVGALASQGTVAGSSGTVNAALGVLASGASATLSIVANLAVVGANANSAIVASDAIDPNPGDNASSWITTVTKPPATDLLVDARASQSSAPVGANVTFTFLVVNNGPDDSTGIQLTVPLPAGMSFVSASGGITPVSGTLNFALGPLAAGAIASANATLNGTVPGNVVSFASATSIEGGSNSASVTVSVFQPAPPLVDLAVTTSVNDTYVPPGGSLVYTIVVANNSPTVATGVVLTNKLPASAAFVSATSSSGTVAHTNGLVIANLGSVTRNAPVTLTINARPSQPDVLINRTTVTSAEPDANPGDNVFYVLALSEVVITSVDQVGADLRLTFETSLGKSYVVQTESDLTEGQWVDVPGSNSTGTGHILPVTISHPFTQPHQFYRVVLTP